MVVFQDFFMVFMKLKSGYLWSESVMIFRNVYGVFDWIMY